MKTYNAHSFHGITLRDDAYGWTIQIKMLGKTRQIRTYAKTPEIAAQRYDVVLSKLDGFAEPDAVPNFPEDFNAIDLSRAAYKEDDGGLDFFNDLQKLFSALCQEAEAVGLDPVEMGARRAEAARQNLEREVQKLSQARFKLSDRLFKVRNTIPSLGLPADASRKLIDLITTAQQVLNEALNRK